MDHPVPEQDKQEPLWFGWDSSWAVAVGSCPSFYVHLVHILFLAALFLSPAPNLTSVLVLQCFHGSLCSKRNFGNGFPGVRTIMTKVQRSWDLSHFDLWEKNLYFKKSEFYDSPPPPKYFMVTSLKWYTWTQFCLIQDSSQIESFPVGKYK